ncbi:SPOR domain-containing protein [Sagittula salina]|uniref:SPOR domain-containing protein n=1 Tax=Sagittula salina TaxID=2820268 RepID=A0A940S281_9RHOB|nr:SPOR domain-containing protein [Sagittula salina]MBP0483831.1 SPOR domain-containing protein [Sagittula salina]
MTINKLALCATIVTYLAGLGGAASAQNAIPANFPPKDYQGRQFVDNAGCVFVRAGFDGLVNWVPRVTRQRKQLCGQTPTFGGSATVQATAPAPQRVATAPAPVQITMAPKPEPAPVAAPARTAVAPVRATPQPVVRRTTTPPRAPVVIKAPVSKPAYAEPPRVVRRMPATTAPSPTASTARARIPVQEACAAGRNSSGGTPIRCGPQTKSHVTIVRRGEAPGPGKNVYYNRSSWEDSALSPQTRIVPRKVYEARDAQIASVPAGYKPAWEDDRLNPYRAIQTVQGYMDTQEVWSNQVPRRLISQANPRQPFPKNLWTTKYRHEVKPLAVAYRATQGYPPAEVRMAYAEQSVYRTDVLSTRSAQPAPTGGYVEIGVFTTRAKAQAAAARLAAAGLPVKAATITRGDASMQRLRVGPYGSAAALHSALSAVHGAGYTSAYLR